MASHASLHPSWHNRFKANALSGLSKATVDENILVDKFCTRQGCRGGKKQQRNGKKSSVSHIAEDSAWICNFKQDGSSRRIVSKMHKTANTNESTHCWATECRAPELQPAFSRPHSFSTWAQPSSPVGLSKLAGLRVRVKSVVSVNERVCEGPGSREFPVRSKWAGQTSRIKPCLCSAALYILLWPPLFPPPISLALSTPLF